MFEDVFVAWGGHQLHLGEIPGDSRTLAAFVAAAYGHVGVGHPHPPKKPLERTDASPKARPAPTEYAQWINPDDYDSHLIAFELVGGAI